MKRLLAALALVNLTIVAFSTGLYGKAGEAVEEVLGKAGAVLVRCSDAERRSEDTAYLCATYASTPEFFIRYWDLFLSDARLVEKYGLENPGAWKLEDAIYTRRFLVDSESHYVMAWQAGRETRVKVFRFLNLSSASKPAESQNETSPSGTTFVSRDYAYVSIREFAEAFSAQFTKEGKVLTLFFNADTLVFTSDLDSLTDTSGNQQPMIGKALIVNGVFVVPARVFSAYGCSLAPAPGDPFSILMTCPITKPDGSPRVNTFILKRY
jgi:hypothetical protein